MQNRQHRAVARGIEEFVGMPTGGQRSGFRFAVANHAAGKQVRIVEDRAIGVRQRIAQFSAFVNRPGSFGRDVTRDSAGEGELREQALHAFRVARDVGIELAVGALQPGIGNQAGTSVPGTGNVNRIEIVLLDHAIEMHVDQVETGSGAPMPEQPGFDVLEFQRLFQ